MTESSKLLDYVFTAVISRVEKIVDRRLKQFREDLLKDLRREAKQLKKSLEGLEK